MNNSSNNGLSTQDTSRIQGQGPFQEGQVPRYNLQQQTGEGLRGDDGKKDRIIYIENLSEHRTPFIIRKVKTVQDIYENIYNRLVSLNREKVGLSVYSSRFGTTKRLLFDDVIPVNYEDLYIRLYIIKQ